MKINEIEVSGFKGIPELIIHPKLINILVGKNNTGKTSILEAINHAFEVNLPAIQKNYGPHLSSLINVNKTESKIILKLENENRYLFLRRLELKEIIPEFKKQLMTNIKEIPYHTSTKIEWEKVEELIDKILTKEDLLHEIEKESIRIESGNEVSYLFSYTPLILREIEPLIEYLNQKIFRIPLNPYFLTHSGIFSPPIIDKKNQKDLSFIKKLDADRRLVSSLNKSKINEIEIYLKDRKILENLERFDFDKLFFKSKEKEYEVPFSFMGEGLKSLIGLIAQTPKETKIVLIEEPENHMHPAYIKELVRQIIDFSIVNNVQFFITTHNSDILDVVTTGLIEPQYQEYLAKGLNVIKLDCLDGDIMVQELDRTDALEELDDLKIDLRGK